MNSEGPRYSRFGEMVYMDCWKIDIVVRLKKLGIWMKMTAAQKKEWGARRRIWICVAIDLATRMVIGIGFGLSECTELTRRVLRMAVSDKSAFVEATNCLAPPPPNYGVEGLGTDSGEAFLDDHFRIPALTLVPNTKIGIVKKPWRRGVMERLFGTIKNQLLPYFDGLTFGNSVERGDYDAMGNATMFLEEFGTAFFRYLNDVYHLQGHRGLKKQPPVNRAIELVESTGGPDTYTNELLRFAFGINATLPLTDEGLTFAGIRYRTEWLRQLHPGLREMRVKIDPIDLGCISVAHAGLWHTVPGPVELCGTGLTQWRSVQAQLARKHGEQAKLNFPIVAKALISFGKLGAAARIKAQIHDQSYDSVTVLEAARSLRIQPMYRPAVQPSRSQWTLSLGWLSDPNAEGSPTLDEQTHVAESNFSGGEADAELEVNAQPAQPRPRSTLKLRAPAHQKPKDRE
ncbi:MAG TPA: hypothetical protein VGN79_03400 [Devosia sp.]|nr:hypothetical protein [Devosia sp.]